MSLAEISMPGGIEWIIILVIGLIIFGVPAVILAVLFARSKHKGRWLAGIGIGFATLVLIGITVAFLGFYLLIPRWQPAVELAQPVEVAPPDEYEALAFPPAWKPDNVVDWRADVYPSIESAARALGAQIAPLLEDDPLPNGHELRSVQVYGQVEPDVRSAAAAGILGQLPTVEVIVHATPPSTKIIADARKQGAIHVVVDIANRFTNTRPGHRLPRERFSGQEHGGTLRLSIAGGPRDTSRSVRYIEKRWVDDYAGFLNMDPGHQWIVGASHAPCTSEGEAKQQAAESAALQLTPLALKRIQQLDDSVHPITPSRESVRSWFESRLQTEAVLSDRFVQRYLRPYGEIWREEVLVEVTPALVDDCAEALLGTHIARRGGLRRTILSVAGMVLLICLMYLFLNAVTKGYFAGMLRIGVVVVIVIGVAVVLLIA